MKKFVLLLVVFCAAQFANAQFLKVEKCNIRHGKHRVDNMFTKDEYYEDLIKIATAPKKNVLSDSVLETLSIVAYKQPVTRMDIEKIRGVNSDFSINKLLEFGLIKELGRLDAPGRPLLFGTSEQFLRAFNVDSIEDLPQISMDMMEDFRVQAENELNYNVNKVENVDI